MIPGAPRSCPAFPSQPRSRRRGFSPHPPASPIPPPLPVPPDAGERARCRPARLRPSRPRAPPTLRVPGPRRHPAAAGAWCVPQAASARGDAAQGTVRGGHCSGGGNRRHKQGAGITRIPAKDPVRSLSLPRRGGKKGPERRGVQPPPRRASTPLPRKARITLQPPQGRTITGAPGAAPISWQTPAAQSVQPAPVAPEDASASSGTGGRSGVQR